MIKKIKVASLRRVNIFPDLLEKYFESLKILKKS